jgi:hypothetical protein
MIERLLAPTPPTQLTELITEPPEVKKKSHILNIINFFS